MFLSSVSRISASSVRIRARSFASRFESGSSNRKVDVFRTSARPIATRCRWPPDSSAGLRLRSWEMFSISATSFTLRSMSAFGSRCSLSEKDMFRAMFMCG